MEGDGWGELGQILTGMGLPWRWHLLKDEGMFGAAGFGGHQQIHTGEPVLAACVTPGGSFKHTPGFPATQRVSVIHLPAPSILCMSGTHNQACVEHLLREGAYLSPWKCQALSHAEIA